MREKQRQGLWINGRHSTLEASTTSHAANHAGRPAASSSLNRPPPLRPLLLLTLLLSPRLDRDRMSSKLSMPVSSLHRPQNVPPPMLVPAGGVGGGSASGQGWGMEHAGAHTTTWSGW